MAQQTLSPTFSYPISVHNALSGRVLTLTTTTTKKISNIHERKIWLTTIAALFSNWMSMFTLLTPDQSENAQVVKDAWKYIYLWFMRVFSIYCGLFSFTHTRTRREKSHRQIYTVERHLFVSLIATVFRIQCFLLALVLCSHILIFSAFLFDCQTIWMTLLLTYYIFLACHRLWSVRCMAACMDLVRTKLTGCREIRIKFRYSCDDISIRKLLGSKWSGPALAGLSSSQCSYVCLSRAI